MNVDLLAAFYVSHTRRRTGYEETGRTHPRISGLVIRF